MGGGGFRGGGGFSGGGHFSGGGGFRGGPPRMGGGFNGRPGGFASRGFINPAFAGGPRPGSSGSRGMIGSRPGVAPRSSVHFGPRVGTEATARNFGPSAGRSPGPLGASVHGLAIADGKWHSFGGVNNTTGPIMARNFGGAAGPTSAARNSGGAPGQWRPFGGPSNSATGSTTRSWSGQGRRIWANNARAMTSAGVTTSPSGATSTISPPRALSNIENSRFSNSPRFGRIGIGNSRFSSTPFGNNAFRNSAFGDPRLGVRTTFNHPFTGTGFGDREFGFRGFGDRGFGFRGRDFDFDDFRGFGFGGGCWGCGFGFGWGGWGFGWGAWWEPGWAWGLDPYWNVPWWVWPGY
jgi:hypothetical protein